MAAICSRDVISKSYLIFGKLRCFSRKLLLSAVS
jgi:hypothetical protein